MKSNVVNLLSYKKTKLVDSQILDFFYTQPFPYEFFHNEGSDDALIVINKEQKHLFIFFEYIPEGTFTEYPSIYDRAEDITRSARISSGEWVVFDLFLLRKEESRNILNALNKDNDTTEFIKKMKEKILEIN